MKESEYIKTIRQITIPIDKLHRFDPNIAMFKWLSSAIYAGKARLRKNSVRFIIVNILDRNRRVRNIHREPLFDVYVIGEFRKTFTPVLSVAETFSTFYLEMGVLPNIIPIPKHTLIPDSRIFNKLKNCVLLYERR